GAGAAKEGRKNKRETDGEDGGEPAPSLHQLLVLTSPHDPAPRRQRDRLGDPQLRLLDERPEIPAAGVRLDDDAPLAVLAADLIRPFAHADARERGEWDGAELGAADVIAAELDLRHRVVGGRERDRQRLEHHRIGPELLGESDDDVEASVALKNPSSGASSPPDGEDRKRA